jgi:hypothetical protein
MNKYQVQIKNVGSGLLFEIYEDGNKVYTHLVTEEMVEKSKQPPEENENG